MTNPEIERLAILAEEMGEAIQIIGKILRHGFENGNRELLEKELGDVKWAISYLCDKGDISRANILKFVCDKSRNVKKYLHHND